MLQRHLVPGQDAQKQRPRFAPDKKRQERRHSVVRGKDAQKMRRRFVPGKHAQEKRHRFALDKDAQEQRHPFVPDKTKEKKNLKKNQNADSIGSCQWEDMCPT